MDEARKFLRYVIPVAVFAIETSLLLWIIFPPWTVQTLNNIKSEGGVGLAVIGIVGSGGLGFLFSALHHLVSLHLPKAHRGVNHHRIIGNLKASGVLLLKNSSTKEPAPLDWPRTEAQAWSIIASLWHERNGKDSMIQFSNFRSESLANLVHSTGACVVAAAASLVATLIIAGQVGTVNPTWETSPRFAGSVILGLLLILLHERSYRDTVDLASSFVEETLADTLAKEKLDLKLESVETYIPIQSKEASSKSPKVSASAAGR